MRSIFLVLALLAAGCSASIGVSSSHQPPDPGQERAPGPRAPERAASTPGSFPPASGPTAAGPPAAAPSSSAPTPPAAGAAPAPASPAGDPSALAQAGEELAAIRTVFRSLPRGYRGLTDEALKQLTASAKRGRQRAEAYLADFPGSPGDPEVRFMLAKLLLVLNQVEWAERLETLKQSGIASPAIERENAAWREGYFARMAELGRGAVAGMDRSHPARAEAQQLLGDVLAQGKQPAEAIAVYQQLIAEFPDFPAMPDVLLAMASCSLDLHDYAEAESRVRQAITRQSRSPLYPSYFEWLRKVHHAAGDLPALLKAVQGTREALSRRLERKDLETREKETADRLLAHSGFFLGYYQFAMGDHAAALQAFRSHIADMDRLQSERGSLPADYNIMRDFRSRDYVKVLEKRVDRPGPDVRAAVWNGPPPRVPPGKPLAILLRKPGEPRSAPFLQILNRYHRKRRDAFELCQITPLRVPGGVQEQLAEVGKELESLDVECPSGLDVGEGICQALEASTLTPTLVILDAAGNYVWFQEDTTERDERFSLAILERIIAKGQEPAKGQRPGGK